MIIAPLVGGLANQLVIYAAAKALAEKNNDKVFLDLIYFKRRSAVKFRFDELTIPYDIAPETELLKRFRMLRVNINRYTRWLSLFLFKGINVYKEPCLNFDCNFFDLNGDVYLRGDFVSVNYYSHILDDLKKEFRPRIISETAKDLISKIVSENSVSIHIRRGDYANNPIALHFHGLLGSSYYKKAVELVKVQIENPKFYVFSDDIEIAKKELFFINNHDVVFVSEIKGLNDIDELELMKNTKSNIIANSGFSRWAALLNNNKSPLVVMPKQWFKAESTDTLELGLPDWHRVDSDFL
jgi:hypothetical protein